MVVCVITADDATHRLGKRTVEECFTRIIKQAVAFHNASGNYDILGIAADISERITGSGIGVTRKVHSRLNGEFLARLELVLPFCADFHYFAAEFVTDNNRFLGNIVGNTFVIRALHCRFMRRHTNTVGYDFCKNFVVFDLGKFEFIESEVVLAVKSYSFVQHWKITSDILYI